MCPITQMLKLVQFWWRCSVLISNFLDTADENLKLVSDRVQVISWVLQLTILNFPKPKQVSEQKCIDLFIP